MDNFQDQIVALMAMDSSSWTPEDILFLQSRSSYLTNDELVRLSEKVDLIRVTVPAAMTPSQEVPVENVAWNVVLGDLPTEGDMTPPQSVSDEGTVEAVVSPTEPVATPDVV